MPFGSPAHAKRHAPQSTIATGTKPRAQLERTTVITSRKPKRTQFSSRLRIRLTRHIHHSQRNWLKTILRNAYFNFEPTVPARRKSMAETRLKTSRTDLLRCTPSRDISHKYKGIRKFAWLPGT